MAWNPTFPTPATRISQSVQQIQDNWAFLQTNINTDHFYNSGAPNEGHHRFVQHVNQGADPVVAVAGVLYTKVGLAPDNANQLFFRNNYNVRQVSSYIMDSTVVGGAGVHNLVNLAGTPDFMGFFMAHRQGANGRAFAYLIWDGATIFLTQLSAVGSITAIGFTGTTLQVTTNAGGTIDWMYTTNEFPA